MNGSDKKGYKKAFGEKYWKNAYEVESKLVKHWISEYDRMKLICTNLRKRKQGLEEEVERLKMLLREYAGRR